MQEVKVFRILYTVIAINKAFYNHEISLLYYSNNYVDMYNPFPYNTFNPTHISHYDLSFGTIFPS